MLCSLWVLVKCDVPFSAFHGGVALWWKYLLVVVSLASLVSNHTHHLSVTSYGKQPHQSSRYLGGVLYKGVFYVNEFPIS